MDLSKKEADKLKKLADRVKAAETAVKDLEIDRRDSLAALFDAVDGGKNADKLRKTANTLKNRLEDARLKIGHCDKKLKAAISEIIVRRMSKLPQDLESLKADQDKLMAECGRNLARLREIFVALGPEFTSQREGLDRFWKDAHHQALEYGAVIIKAFEDTDLADIPNIHQERNRLNQIKANPEALEARLYSRSIRGDL